MKDDSKQNQVINIPAGANVTINIVQSDEKLEQIAAQLAKLVELLGGSSQSEDTPAAGYRRPGMLKAEEVAEMLGVSKRTVYLWVRDGIMPSVRIGKTVRFNRSDIVEWQKANRHLVSGDKKK